MMSSWLACGLTVVTAFQTLATHYEMLSSVHFHNQLRLAVRDEKDGVVIAFLDETVPNSEDEANEFNTAAGAIRCLFKGGVHAMHVGEEDRAKFIATRFFADYGLVPTDGPQYKPPPFAALFFDARPVSTHASGDWTASALTAWAYTAFGNVTFVEDGSALAAFETRTPQFALGVFPGGLCSNEAQPMRDALELMRKRGTSMPFAFTTDLDLAQHVVPGSGGTAGLFAVLSGGSRMRFPDALPKVGKQYADWLEGLGIARSTFKDEI
jgi:hypothetical protein